MLEMKAAWGAGTRDRVSDHPSILMRRTCKRSDALKIGVVDT